MGEAEDTAEGPVPDTQDVPKKKKKTDVKTKPVQSKNKRSEEGNSDSLDKKLAGLNDTEIALKSITVKVRNKLLFNSSGMEGGWFDQVYYTTSLL